MGAPSKLGFRSDHNFFGFKSEDRLGLHDNIFNIIWHGEGSWSWDDIYNMPVPLRRHWIKRINTLVHPDTTDATVTGPNKMLRGKKPSV